MRFFENLNVDLQCSSLAYAHAQNHFLVLKFPHISYFKAKQQSFDFWGNGRELDFDEFLLILKPFGILQLCSTDLKKNNSYFC